MWTMENLHSYSKLRKNYAILLKNLVHKHNLSRDRNLSLAEDGLRQLD